MPDAPASSIFHHARPTTVTVEFMDRPWTLTPSTAYEWLGAVAYDLELLSGVLPGAVGANDVPAMSQLLLGENPAGSQTEPRRLAAARTAVGRAGGRDWWWVVNLTSKTVKSWPYINGRLLLSGVNPRHMPFPDWLDAAYMMLWTGSDEDNRIKLDLELTLPPAGVPIRQTKTQTKQMLADFAAD